MKEGNYGMKAITSGKATWWKWWKEWSQGVINDVNYIESEEESTNAKEIKDGDKFSSYEEASQKDEWNKVIEEEISALE